MRLYSSTVPFHQSSLRHIRHIQLMRLSLLCSLKLRADRQVAKHTKVNLTKLIQSDIVSAVLYIHNSPTNHNHNKHHKTEHRAIHRNRIGDRSSKIHGITKPHSTTRIWPGSEILGAGWGIEVKVKILVACESSMVFRRRIRNARCILYITTWVLGIVLVPIRGIYIQGQRSEFHYSSPDILPSH